MLAPRRRLVRQSMGSGGDHFRTGDACHGVSEEPLPDLVPCRRVYLIRRTGMCTARDRSSLIPSRVSPRWRATLRAGSRWRATLRAGESLDGSNPAAREPLRAGESTHLRSQRTPAGYLARGTPPSSPRGDAANSKTALAGMGHVPWAQGWLDRLPCVL